MSIRLPDERELKLDVSLSAIYMPEVGQANGYYSVFNFAPDPQNLRPINYDNKNNNPKIVFNTGGSQTVGRQYSDFKLGSRVKFIPSLQNAHIVETITHPTASSCTFALGGILTDTAHPTFNSLKGPTAAEYTAFPGYLPVRSSTVSNLSTPDLRYNFSDLENFKPLIPFIKEYSYSTDGNTFSRPPTYQDSIKFSHWVMFNNLSNSLYATYNIWNLVDSNEAPLSTSVKEFEGPVGTNVSGKNKASIKTIRDGINGSRLFIDSKGKGKSCIVKRIFPTSKDVVYNNPFIFFPTKIRNSLTSATEYLILNGERINAQSSANCGFHIQLSNLNANASDSNISIIYEDKLPKDNTIYAITVNLSPNTLPQIITKYKSNNNDFFYKYDQIKAPLFDGKATLGYDIFIHFVGPVMLVGFTNDQSTWNAIYPEEVASSNTVIDPASPLQDKSNIEHYFGKDTSYVKILALNASFEMRYSSILFNNYCKPSSVSTDNFEDRRAVTFSSIVSFILVTPGLELLNTKNHILMTFTSPQSNKDLIGASSIGSSFHSAKYYGRNGNRYQTIPNGTISAMPDWRTLIPTNTAINPIDFVYKQIASSIDTNTPYNIQQYTKTWGNLFFNSTIEGPAFLSLESPAQNNPAIDFLFPIEKGNLTPWVSDISVNCSTDLANFSLIRKRATINLLNLDTTINGLNLLELMEQNILVVTVKAGYGNASYNYFQGVIDSISTTRTGSQSNISLQCQDLGNYIMDGLFFDYIVPFGNRSIKTCIQAVMNFSGFSKYYSIQNENQIGGLNLRIVNNPAANPDAIRATNFDKIGEKMGVFLSKLMTLEKLPTFRWLENTGFVLDARYADNNLDDDLKFFGYDATPNSTNQTLSMRSTLDNKTPDWHGLLDGSFSISTRLSPLSYHVSTYGFTYEGLIEKHTSEKFHDQKMSVQSRDNVVKAITNGVVPKSYVGFRKKVIDSLEKNEYPTSELVELKHAQNEKITSIPIHDLGFSCYVTRPLKIHGLFRINALADSTNLNDPTLSITSKYIYQSVNYTISKSQNLITAQVNGFSHPWLIQDLKVSGE